MLGLFAVGFWNISLAVNDFYNYDVITNVERVTPENVTFPAITICTDNFFREDFFVNGVLNRSEEIFLEDKFQELFYLAEFKTINQTSGFWNTLNVKNELEYFEIPINSYHQPCLRFNAARNNKTRQLMTVSSTKDHFFVYFRNKLEHWSTDNVLKRNESYRLSFSDRKVSFYVYITHNNLDSFKKIAAIELDVPKSGYTFKIDVAAEETKLPEPYNHCKESPYNQMNCIEQCIHNRIRSVYNCTLGRSLFTIEGVEECAIIDSLPYESYVKNEFFDGCRSECPLADCNAMKLFSEYLDEWSLLKYELQDSIENSDLTVFSFHLRDLSYLNITQIPKTDGFTFLNNIGGGLGLFMGLALPNFIEFLQFIVDILIIAVFDETM